MTKTPQHHEARRRSIRVEGQRSPRRALVLCTVFALLMGAWLGTTGTVPAKGGSSVSLKLVDSGGGSSTTTTTPSGDSPSVTPAPAPAGYADQLTGMYDTIYANAVTLPDSVTNTAVMTPAQFSDKVAALDSSQLGYINQALPTATIVKVTTDLTKATPVAANMAHAMRVAQVKVDRVATSLSARRTSRVSGHVSSRLVTPQSLTTVPLTMPTNDPFAGDVGSLTYTASCPAGAPGINSSDVYGEGDIFALQIAIDVVSGVYNGISPWAGIGTPVEIGFSVAAVVIAAIGLALAVAHDTLSYFQTIAGDCQGAQMQQVGQNTENNTYQTYTLLTNVAGTVNEIDSNLANLTNLVTNQFNKQLALDIETALTAPIGSVHMASMELPGSDGGYLDSAPGTTNPTVESVVSVTIASIQASGQTMSPMATRYLGLAEQSLGAGEYKLSFDYYRLAYQAAAG